MNKVEIESNRDHACTGYVLSDCDTGRTIGSFWHDYDAEDAMNKINNHDALVEALEFMVCQFDAEECMYNEADLQAVSQAKNALEKAKS